MSALLIFDFTLLSSYTIFVGKITHSKTTGENSSCYFNSNRSYLKVKLMHGSILPVTIPSPGNPGDKSSPSGPGVGNCLKTSCPGGSGAGKIENNFLLFL